CGPWRRSSSAPTSRTSRDTFPAYRWCLGCFCARRWHSSARRWPGPRRRSRWAGGTARASGAPWSLETAHGSRAPPGAGGPGGAAVRGGRAWRFGGWVALGGAVVAEVEFDLAEPAGPYIHPAAMVSSRAELADGVHIGPFAVIGPEVRIGVDCRVGAHAVVEG